MLTCLVDIIHRERLEERRPRWDDGQGQKADGPGMLRRTELAVEYPGPLAALVASKGQAGKKPLEELDVRRLCVCVEGGGLLLIPLERRKRRS